MAAHWIKVEKQTLDKPEMARMAKLIGCTLDEAIVACLRVWCWADGLTETGEIPHTTLDDVDTLSHARTGTARAMADPGVGWLIVIDGGVRLSKWDRHNGQSAKKRLTEAAKKREQRSRQRTETESSPADASSRPAVGIRSVVHKLEGQMSRAMRDSG